MDIKCILVNGFYASGASAVIDYLKEFEGVFAPDMEFRLLKEPHGIIDLDRVLNGHNDLLNEDIAIREFLMLANKYIPYRHGFNGFGMGYDRFFGKNLFKITNKYVDSLVECKYPGHWWYLDLYSSSLSYVIHKILRKIGLYDNRLNSHMYFRTANEEDFLEKTRAYLKEIIDDCINDIPGVDTFIFDQAIPANQPSLAQRYFPGCKFIVVDRDPRAIYAETAMQLKEINRNLGQIGPYAKDTDNVKLFIDYYKKMRERSEYSGECLRIQFEDFVLNKNNTRKIVLDYVGINEEKHKFKEVYFQPSVSKNNVYLWERFDCKKECEIIEKELSEYIYV